MNYKAKQYTVDNCFGSSWLIGKWNIFNELGDEIFGDTLPRDQEEAEQCARAANIASSEVKNSLRKNLEKTMTVFSR